MTATEAERAVINASRRVFQATDQRGRVDRLGILKTAVDALELELTAEALDGTATRDEFAALMGKLPGTVGTRAVNVMIRRFGSPEELARADFQDVQFAHQAGPRIWAAWAAVLIRLGMRPTWLAGVKDEAFDVSYKSFRVILND